MARRVLIVSTVEHGNDVLQAHVGEADEIKVVVPVSDRERWTGSQMTTKRLGMRSGSLNARPISSLARRSRRLPGKQTSVWRFAMLWQRFRPTSILVAVRPSDEEGLVESVATDSAPQRSVEGVPVRFVVIPD